MLCRAGMTPNVTLHWFAHPQWIHELGDFQKEENIPLFVDWAETAFKHFGRPSCMQSFVLTISAALSFAWLQLWHVHHAVAGDAYCCAHTQLVRHIVCQSYSSCPHSDFCTMLTSMH